MNFKEGVDFVVANIKTLDDWNTLYSIMKTHRDKLIVGQSRNIYVGQTVTFEGRRGISYTGKVMKVNQKSVKIDCGADGKWNVSPVFIKA